MANTYILVVMGILLAKAGGFLRDAVFASSFGTNAEADIYLSIFGVASLIFTAIGSALSTLVIKNVNKSVYSQGDAQKYYAAHFIRQISLIIIAITAVLYIFAKPIVHLLLPALDEAGAQTAQTIMYIMLPSFLFISVAYMMSGLLQNRRVFFTPSVMSLPYNIIVICALLLGVRDIVAISMITTFGWFLHIVILLPDFYRKGYGFFVCDKSVEKGSGFDNTKETFFIFISGLMFQLCFMIDKVFASYDSGMASTLSYASNLFITVSGVFVVAMSSVVFPAISQNFEHGEMDYVRELLRYIIKLMLSIFAFYLVAVVFFGEDIIRIIYERGAFTPESTKRVGEAFVIYSFGIFGYLAQNILNKIFYLAGRYKLTVLGAIGVVCLKLIVDIFMPNGLGANFTAATSTVLLTVYAVFIAIKLKDIIGEYLTGELGMTVLKIAFSALCSAITAFAVGNILPQNIQNSYFGFSVPLTAALAVYAAIMLVTGVLKDLFATPLSKSSKESKS